MSNLKKVEEFYNTFGMEIAQDSSVIPTEVIRKKRLDLALEELFELAEAFGMPTTFSKMLIKKATEKITNDTLIYNKQEVLDALCDSEYINNGTILECGMKNIYNEAFQEVHESNLSKACETLCDAVETVNTYKENGVDCNHVSFNDKFLVFRKDGKLLKIQSL